MLVIGGQAQDFARVAGAFISADQAGAGTLRVIMPDSTEKFTRMLPNIEYAPSNPSGSFSKRALADFLDASLWADHVLLAGDLGKNSETTTILDGYLLKCPTPVSISSDALDSIAMPRLQLLQRPIILNVNLKQLQKLGVEYGLTTAPVSGSNQTQLSEILQALTTNMSGSIIYRHDDHYWIAHNGLVCSSPAVRESDQQAAHAAVWAMQQPAKLYEALVCSLLA